MGIFDLFRPKKIESDDSKESVPNLVVSDNSQYREIHGRTLYKWIGFNSEYPSKFSLSLTQVDELKFLTSKYFNDNDFYSQTQIHSMGMEHGFNVWKFAIWERYIVEYEVVNGQETILKATKESQMEQESLERQQKANRNQ